MRGIVHVELGHAPTTKTSIAAIARDLVCFGVIMARAQARAVKVVALHECAVKMLAGELIKCGELSGARVNELWRAYEWSLFKPGPATSS